MFLKGFDILLIFVVVFEKLFWCPFNKIEEGFNVQASHDLFYHSPHPSTLSEFHHQQYPDPVPRTFLGSATLHLIARVWEYATTTTASQLGFATRSSSPATTSSEMLHKWYRYLLIRTILACLNLWGYLRIRLAIRRCFGSLAARIFTLAVSLQFHLIFYASRLLPNSLALPLSSFALANFIEWQFNPAKSNNNQQALNCFKYLFIGTFIFRCEFSSLMIPLLALFVWNSKFQSSSYSTPSLFSVIFSLQLQQAIFIFLLSIALDSFLWYDSAYSHEIQSALQFVIQRLSHLPVQLPHWFQLMWPEFYSFTFNVVEDNMKRWGVSPFWWYFTSAVPRTVGLFLFGLIGVFRDRGDGKRKALVFATLFWAIPIVFLSFLAHKELRFIFPSSVGLTAFASIGFSRLLLADSTTKNSKQLQSNYSAVKQWDFATVVWGVILFCICSCAAVISMASFLASVYNYPGGWALMHFNSHGVVRRCPQVPPGQPGAFKWSPLQNNQPISNQPYVVHPTIPIPNRQLNGITAIAVPALLPNFITTVPKSLNNTLTSWNTNNKKQQQRDNTESLNTCRIHSGNYATQTGVSRFLEFRGIEIEDDKIWCNIDKTPDHLLNPDDFDFLISEIPVPPPGFVLLYSIPQYRRYSMSYKEHQWKGISLPKLEVAPTVFVYAAKPQC